MTKVSRYIRALCIASSAAVVCVSMLTSCAQKETIKSNKRERNAIKDGNKLYDKKKYIEAVKSYDEALEANPSSDRAVYNRALSALMSGEEADTALLSNARKSLNNLVDGSSDAEVREYALYTLGNDAVYIGDELAKMAETEPALADSLKQMSTESYKQAIHNYEELLRRKPGDIRVMQNLRIAQLKLPPEQQQQQQQKQKQKQKEQQQQQQSQPQEQKQKQQDEALKALEMREMKTRQKQEKPNQQNRRQTDKPW